jgi:hypothetical protein
MPLPEPPQLDFGSYLYRAHATAATGKLTLPVQRNLELQASIGLPLSGGVGETKSGPFSFEGIVSFESAHSKVIGVESEKSHSTLAQTTIEGLNILNVVTCDQIVSRVAVRQEKSADKDRMDPAPYITPNGSSFKNLRIGGFPIEPVWASGWFSDHGTWDDFTKNADSLGSQMVKQAPESYHCSMVEKWGALPQGIHPLGHGLWVPEFGVVFLGEIFVHRTIRAVRMLRVQLGCAVDGGVSNGCTSGGGTPIG